MLKRLRKFFFGDTQKESEERYRKHNETLMAEKKARIEQEARKIRGYPAANSTIRCRVCDSITGFKRTARLSSYEGDGDERLLYLRVECERCEAITQERPAYNKGDQQ